jgi:hypothetical protein
MIVPSIRQFRTIVSAGFPSECGPMALAATSEIESFVNNSYDAGHVFVSVNGQQIEIQNRIYFRFKWSDKLSLLVTQNSSLPTLCLLTRSADGYSRQAALTKIIFRNEPWVVPYVLLLAGEYVIEIVELMVNSLDTLDRDAYANFARENPKMMNRLKSQAISYWDCYYRRRFPDRNTYPGTRFLHEIEKWAASPI